MPERTLNDLLLAGEIDALIAAHPPHGLRARQRSHRAPVLRLPRGRGGLLPATGVFPIMHVVALRADVHERHPWIAMNLLTAFEEAKRRSLERALDANAPRFPVPWGPANAQRAQRADRRGLLALRHRAQPPHARDVPRSCAFEQGVCARRLTPEELFVPEVQQAYRI